MSGVKEPRPEFIIRFLLILFALFRVVLVSILSNYAGRLFAIHF